MALRLNESISMGLQFIAVMQFNIEDKILSDQKCIVVTDRMGVIQSLTRSAKEIFQKNESIFSLNKKLENIYKVNFLE